MELFTGSAETPAIHQVCSWIDSTEFREAKIDADDGPFTAPTRYQSHLWVQRPTQSSKSWTLNKNRFFERISWQNLMNCNRQRRQPIRSESGLADVPGKRIAKINRRFNRSNHKPAGNVVRELFSAPVVGTRNMISIPSSSDFML